MSTLIRFVVETHCRSCGHDQMVRLELPQPYTDAELKDALDDCQQECSDCGDQDWQKPSSESVRVQP